MTPAPQRSLWRRLTPRILLSTGLAATLSVAVAASLWTRFFMNEIRLQVARYTQDVVEDNVPRCLGDPAGFGRRREMGRFDAFDAATLRSENPSARPPDPELVARLRAGEAVPARVDWSWSGAMGGAAQVQVAPDGPCSLFELHWYAPPGSRQRLLVLVLALTIATLGGTVAFASALVVRPLVRRLARLCAAAERVGDDGFQPVADREADDLGELSRILDGAHERVRGESTRLRSRHDVLLAHLEDVAHDLRTPLTAIQIGIERASDAVGDPGARRLIRSALTDVAYTSELTENLRLAARLERPGEGPEPWPVTDLTAVVERAVARFSLLGRHLGVSVEAATPRDPVWAATPAVWAERAVASLIHNAVTRARDGGHVAVMLEIESVAAFRLTVLDDGPAPPPAARVERRSPSGRGLAMVVTSEICRRNAWELQLDPLRPDGLSAVLRGDRAAPPAAAPSDPPPGGGPEPARLPSAHAAGGADEAGGAPARPLADEPPPRPHPWRRLAPRIALSAGLVAVSSTLLIGGFLTRFLVGEILDGVGRYADSVVADGVVPCRAEPESWSKVRRVGRLDAYDAATLLSANPTSPPLDPILAARVAAGESRGARLMAFRDGRWGGVVVLRVAAGGPCSLFQMSWLSAQGSSARGLGLLVTLTLGAIGVTMALSSMAVVRPLLWRLVRLRRAAARLGAREGYHAGSDTAGDEIGRLSGILDRAHERVRAETQQLTERLKQLERHLDDIGHELRTPLSSAQISLEMAARVAESSETLAAIRGALSDVVYASNLVQNLRLRTQLRQGGEAPDAVTELNEVVERVVARFALLGRQRGVKLEGALPRGALVARAHPVWTEQALANVAQNAVGHVGAGANVAVILEAVDRGRFRISVADDGPGVPAPELGRIAERSFRLPGARRRQPGGAGLGLAITAEVCRRSGWTLRFEPEQPRGLRVTIEGPLHAPAPAGAGGVAPPGPPQAPPG